MVLLILTGSLMGIHLALVIILGLDLIGVLYWLWVGVPAFVMACLHPDPQKWSKPTH